MAILEKEVSIKYNSKKAKYYENLGYSFPKSVDKWGKQRTKRGEEIFVKVEDLSDGSNIKVTKICDICGKKNENPRPYYEIINSRKKHEDGLDRCDTCAKSKNGIKSGVANEFNCIATTHPEFAKLFWNVEDTYKYKAQSNRVVDFKCPDCGNKLINKIINTVFNSGLFCSICSDGVPYTEKIIFSALEQLQVEFNCHKKFEWSNNKVYDFYLPCLNIIIETHGKQHYEKTNRGRSLKEEQENDRLKELYAKENGINGYFVIDCRKSELEFIKNNILGSGLNCLFDLSKVDWLKCHKHAVKSLVKVASDLWENLNSVPKISKILKLSKATTGKYLKQGAELGLCSYDPKKVLKEIQNNNKKRIVQLTLDGEFIQEWESGADAGRGLGIDNSLITSVCKGRSKATRGFKFMYKKEYVLYMEQMR